MMHKAWSSIEEVSYCFARSSIKFQGRTALKIVEFDPNWAFLDCNSSLNSPMATKCCAKLETAKERCPIVFQGHPSNFKVTQYKTKPILTQIGRFRTIGRSQLSNPSDLPCCFHKLSRGVMVKEFERAKKVRRSCKAFMTSRSRVVEVTGHTWQALDSHLRHWMTKLGNQGNTRGLAEYKDVVTKFSRPPYHYNHDNGNHLTWKDRFYIYWDEAVALKLFEFRKKFRRNVSWDQSVLVQIMGCHHRATNPLPELILTRMEEAFNDGVSRPRWYDRPTRQ